NTMRLSETMRRFRAGSCAGVLGALLVASLPAPRMAFAQDAGEASGRRPPVRSQVDSGTPAPYTFIASDRGSSMRQESALRAPAEGGGSMILMEIRTQHASANSLRTITPDLDPRTKPLGW